MKGEKHLKPEQYYSDLYDKATVEECRRIEVSAEKHIPEEPRFDKDGKEINTKALNKMVTELMLYFIKGDRYEKKREKVREWMERDKERDDFFEKAKAPENITCFTCGRLMFVSMTNEEVGFEDTPNRVLYIYDCPLNHLPRRAFYDNREEYRAKEHTCAKCNSTTEIKHERKNDIITTTWTCTHCGEIETSKLDLKSEPVKKEIVDENFERDRNRFCLTDKEGGEYIQARANLEAVSEIMKKKEEKEEKKEIYDQVASMKKLKILELEELLISELEKAKYVKFHMKDPEISKDVQVPFIVYDAHPDRNDRTSTHDLQKLLKKNLEDTNWRLMSDGVHYRLGMLEGRLRAYEQEVDLVKLVEARN